MQINPEEDGITHINVYSKGKTDLGRFLSNFTWCKILTEDGYFDSIEGYWYWLLSDDHERNLLRKVHGFEAKQLGRKLGCFDWPENEFFEVFTSKIKTAILIKLNCDQQSLMFFKKNRLPFKHYYNYGGKVIEPKEGKWIVDFLNYLGKFNAKV